MRSIYHQPDWPVYRFGLLKRCGEIVAETEKREEASRRCLALTEEALVRAAMVDDRVLKYLPPRPRQAA